MLRSVLAFLALSLSCPAAGKLVWQPIIDYTISFPGDRADAAPMINPFENFTHFSSDFGWMGPGEGRIDSKGGIIRVKPTGEWTGAWHSLAGLASQRNRTFDPTDLTGLGCAPEKRCGIRELAMNASGRGVMRLELADVTRQVVWQTTLTLDRAGITTFNFPIPTGLPTDIKFMNWIAEPGCDLQLSSISFIAEIQSLFYPDFDRPEPDLLTAISWPDVRGKLLAAQIAYPKTSWPDSAAAGSGIFGLSAGEAGMPGGGYTANGTEVMGVRWLHPHYMMMGLALSAPRLYPQGLRDLDSKQFLFPLGLAENIEADLTLHNPMQGSLNASFEALSACHGWRKRNSPENLIDKASNTDPLLRKGASRFYPPLP